MHEPVVCIGVLILSFFNHPSERVKLVSGSTVLTQRFSVSFYRFVSTFNQLMKELGEAMFDGQFFCVIIFQAFL